MSQSLNNRHKIVQLSRKNGKTFLEYCKKKGVFKHESVYDKWNYHLQCYEEVKELLYIVNDYYCFIIINMENNNVDEWGISVNNNLKGCARYVNN